MDDLILAAIELVGGLLEAALKEIKRPQKRKWALTIFYSVIILSVIGFLIWGAFAICLDGNLTGAIALAAVAGILFLVSGILILRGHRKSWKRKK